MVLLIILGFIVLISGIIGCIIPVIPGPPLSFVALILLQTATHGDAFTINELIFWGASKCASQRCGQFEANRKSVRVHEYIIIFKK